MAGGGIETDFIACLVISIHLRSPAEVILARDFDAACGQRCPENWSPVDTK
jgi:hypothetical protein